MEIRLLEPESLLRPLLLTSWEQVVFDQTAERLHHDFGLEPRSTPFP